MARDEEQLPLEDGSEISCEGGEESISNNATAPAPAIAPGIEDIDARRAAAEIGGAHGGLGIDPRIPELVPGFDGPFFQAGLAGYSDAAMRLIARKHGCPFCVTEALLDRTLLAGGRGFAKADLGEIHDNVPGGEDDHPLAGQIMGSDPREMAASAVKVIEQGTRSDRAYRELAYEDGQFPKPGEHLSIPGGFQVKVSAGPASGRSVSHPNTPETGRRPVPLDPETGWKPVPLSSTAPLPHSSTAPLPFQAIDVNLACPVKKIKAKARGGHWLAEPDGAIRILEAVREAVPKEIPCTLKLRRSFDDTPEMAENFERIFAAAYDIGYAWATVHARTVVQRYVGPSRWTFLKELRERHPEKIFFDSGDIWRAEDIFLMIRYAGVSGVSVAPA